MTPTSTREIIEALKTRISGLGWVRPSTGTTEAAFETVMFHDVTEIEDALQRLVATKARCCLIVFSGFVNSNELAGRFLDCDTRLQFSLVIADRNFGNRTKAWVGGDDQPGVLALMDLVKHGLPGDINVSERISHCEVKNGQGTVLTDKQRDEAAGRAVVFVDVDVVLTRLGYTLEERPV